MRLALLATAFFALLAARPDAGAQSPSRVARIGYLDSGSVAGTTFDEAFRDGLRDLGWVDGQNVVLEVRAAEGRYDRLPARAAEPVRLKVDVIFASSTPAALAAKRATGTIPIVIGHVADPAKSGLVASLVRPGGNVTGWTHQGLEMRVKYLDIFREAVPGARRIGVFWNPGNPIHGPSLKLIESTAQALAAELHPIGVGKPEEIEDAFAALTGQRSQGLIVFLDGMLLSRGPQIVALAAKNRSPTMYGATELVRAGGLMGYGVNLPQMYRHGASFVDRILKGARPADLPVEQPTTFELVVNLRTARALGLTVPPSILARADELIQ
ncbi:MAG TPA: ABC transporter substrate-binding protein [Methylomirabilota bacterium]